MKVVEREIKRAASPILLAKGKLSGIEIFFKRPPGDRFRSSSQTGVYFRTFPPQLHMSRYSSNKIILDKAQDLFSHKKKRAKSLRSRDLLSPYKKWKKKLTMARIECRSNEIKRFLTLFYRSDMNKFLLIVSFCFTLYCSTLWDTPPPRSKRFVSFSF